MSEKQIHIVFQVLNFIFGDMSVSYNLTSDESLMLIVLARHKGKNGIYPSITTLARELKRHKTTILYVLDKLDSKKLIKIIKTPGCSNRYELIFTGSTHTTGSTDATSSMDTTSLVVPVLLTGSTHATQSIYINNKDINKQQPKNLSHEKSKIGTHMFWENLTEENDEGEKPNGKTKF